MGTCSRYEKLHSSRFFHVQSVVEGRIKDKTLLRKKFNYSFISLKYNQSGSQNLLNTIPEKAMVKCRSCFQSVNNYTPGKYLKGDRLFFFTVRIIKSLFKRSNCKMERCIPFSSLKMEAVCSFKMLRNSQKTTAQNPADQSYI
jgi:hypothetical protein